MDEKLIEITATQNGYLVKLVKIHLPGEPYYIPTEIPLSGYVVRTDDQRERAVVYVAPDMAAVLALVTTLLPSLTSVPLS